MSGEARCWWCGDDPLYVRYHDEEWGRPSRDDRYLFEKVCLEGFQAGLSWITILRRRENFRKAFDNFDHHAIAKWKPERVEKLLKDDGIIRHRGKIESVLNNAKRAVELEEEFGSLAAYFWRWEPKEEERPKAFDPERLKLVTAVASSKALSKDLKKRGWTFVGPTTMYAFMQAVGMVNDHVEGCPARAEAEKLRQRFRRAE
jgi:DNA-3-methyladenine glycosylase I